MGYSDESIALADLSKGPGKASRASLDSLSLGLDKPDSPNPGPTRSISTTRLLPTPSHDIQRAPSWFQRTSAAAAAPFPGGWRFGAASALCFSSLVLLANCILAGFAFSQKTMGTIVTLHSGVCDDMDKKATAIHLAINVVSSLLLGGSNYVMQCISAPTRQDVDRAHQRGTWLDIGILSPRNLRSVGKLKLTYWILLVVSSLPLHLVYNSIIFTSTTNHMYDVFVANQQFQQGASFDPVIFPNMSSLFGGYGLPNHTDPAIVQAALHNDAADSNATYERLDPSQCMEAYAKTFITDRRNLVIVTSTSPQDNHQLHKAATLPDLMNPSYQLETVACNDSTPYLDTTEFSSNVSCASNSSLHAIRVYEMGVLASTLPTYSNWYSWICSQPSYFYDKYYIDNTTMVVPPAYLRPPKQICSDGYWKEFQNNQTWSVYGFDVDYCLSEVQAEQCSLKVSTPLLLVVIVFNLIKVIVIATVFFTFKAQPLISIGDAIATFIEHPDVTTRGACLLDKSTVVERATQGRPRWRLPSRRRDDAPPTGFQPASPMVLQTKKLRWFHAAGKTKWIITAILSLMAIMALLGLLGYAVQELKLFSNRGNVKSIWDLGLGTISPYTLITVWNLPMTGNNAVIAMVLIANLPQTLMSVLYVFINTLITNMSLAAEWSAHARRWRTLRVCGGPPSGQQRTAYFLQLPYRLGIPLLCFSILLHWLISQSLFMVQVESRTAVGELFLNLNYSLTTCGFSILGVILVVFGITALFGFTSFLGSRQLKQNGMPLAGSCSVAISAACHAPPGTSNRLPLLWGAVDSRADHRKTSYTPNHEDDVGHCAFANEGVEIPTPGNYYA